ncbi:LacI family transcriptional regulator [Macrococcus armenti]|uniref:LacI family DNA-binding transcriptional regulator n=1 Tax=Macrococcus armenti TaxID=2875764 RepID=UPI001CCC02E2|nr:LacI family DNA-binding transcriptional regulator [Macrococcus armenti]UBH22789.1 LacI family transcriptional regulator [Macrococcus armenti]
MPTIKDVAREAGVSVATVSRAMNSSGYVHEDTLKKINRAIEVLNYQPNETARTLFTKKSKIIGLLLPDISNPFFTLVARGVEDAASAKGFHVVIGNSDQNKEKERQYVDTFNMHNCAGIISSALMFDDAEHYIRKTGMEHIMLDRTGSIHHSIAADHFKGGVLQAQCLIDRQCRRVLVIEGNQQFNSFKQRREGAVSIFKQSKVAYEVMNGEEVSNDQQLLDYIKYNKVDGIICYNDLIAIQVMGMLQHHGVRIPEEVQVVGFDDIQLSEYCYPSLTTIHQPAYLIGKVACEQLIALLHNEKTEQNIKLDVHLIKRNSTRSV